MMPFDSVTTFFSHGGKGWGEGGISIMVYTGRSHSKMGTFVGFSYIKRVPFCEK